MQDYIANAIIERIKASRKQHSGSRGKSKFARALGISPSTYSYYENDRIPPIAVLLKISEVTGVDLDWLLTGRETAKTPVSGPNRPLLLQLDELLTSSPELAEPVLAFVQLLCEKKGLQKELSEIKSAKAARPGWIPVLGRTAAGIVHFWDQRLLPEPKQAITQLDELVRKHTGKTIVRSVDGTVAIDLGARALLDGVKNQQVSLIQVGGTECEQIIEFVQCEDIYKLFPDSFALQIDGDSMSPRINDGDIVILSPSVPVAQGQIGIARLSNQIGVTCKLVRTTETDVHLIPINEKYESKVVPKSDLLWALAVLCHVSL